MNSPEEKIIAATIGCIEKYGIEKTTIRQISKEAGMNSASINYYFRSKEVLMQRVLEVILYNAFDMENFDGTKNFSAKERLICILDGMIAGALQFPNITRALFSDLFITNNTEAPVVQKCNTFMGILEKELTAAYPKKSSEDIRMILIQASSATFLFPGLFPGFFTGFSELNFSDESARKVYVERLVSKLLLD